MGEERRASRWEDAMYWPTGSLIAIACRGRSPVLHGRVWCVITQSPPHPSSSVLGFAATGHGSPAQSAAALCQAAARVYTAAAVAAEGECWHRKAETDVSPQTHTTLHQAATRVWMDSSMYLACGYVAGISEV
ncbi:hypothetical protein K431DRAFT_23164 [Polychaeton citri CBS 116435]|uniref:Uncharacterized protein n=1 Tax=Polychaeton citri CBS 116435 TaxID=1314669 RepID=A0A9P4QEK6_9PEZI|nr:hypothetical protein K431DRAFT_23164 [Polychaeton citri CBS 116435]